MNDPGIVRPLGRSGISVPALGVGTNRWNDSAANQVRFRDTLAAALDTGMGFFDTAELYSLGRSERALGKPPGQTAGRSLWPASSRPFPIVSPRCSLSRLWRRPWRDSATTPLDLYYLHFPYSPVALGTWMRAMASAVRAGKIRAVGISNCSPAQMRKAADILARYEIPLAANQVQYSLLHRKPESDGVLEACRRMDVALVAYRPIGGGAISAGPSSSSSRFALADTLREVAAAHGASATQVALAWLLALDDHVIAIPGATRPEHVRENAGALSLALSEEEFAAIDRASAPTAR